MRNPVRRSGLMLSVTAAAVLLMVPGTRAQFSILDADFGITDRVLARRDLAARAVEARGATQAAMTPAERRAAIDAVWGPGLPTSVKLQIFDTYWNYVDARFPAFQGIDDTWAELRTRYRPEVGAGVSRGRFAAIMNQLSLALRDGHTMAADILINFVTLPAPGIPLLGVGGWVFDTSGACLTAQDDGSALVYRAVSPHPLGLQRGDRILGYDGKPWRQLYQELIAEELPLSPLWWGSGLEGYEHTLTMSAGLNWHLFDTMDVLKHATGTVAHLPTSLMPGPIASPFCSEQMDVPGVTRPLFFGDDLVRWGIVQGTRIGYIYVVGWDDPGVEGFLNAVQDLTQVQDVDGLIIDFRFNVGGILRGPLVGLATLFERPQASKIAMDWRQRPEDHLDMVLAIPPPGFAIDTWIKDHAGYDGPIAVLIGPGAVSAGDFGTIWTSLHPRARTFGKTTAMATGFPTQPGIGNLTLHPQWSGRITETNSYYVDVPHQYLIHTDFPVAERVWLRPDDVAIGKDTVVEAALLWINQQLAGAMAR